jgi:hypothetical protein
MFRWKYLRYRGRRGLVGSSAAAVALAALGLWSFSRCAALPDDRCRDDGIHTEPWRIVSSQDACMTCYCDVNAQLYCVSMGCSLPDAGVMTDIVE